MSEGAAKTEGDAGEKASKKSKLPLIVSAAVLLVGGLTATWYLGLLPFGRAKAEHAEASAAVEEKSEKKSAEGGRGALLPFEPFIANLADEGGKRYLKATFQVEFTGQAVPPVLEAHLPQVRDLVLTLLTSKTYDEIRSPEGKQQLREEILSRVNQVLERDAARAIYFTEFIVQ